MRVLITGMGGEIGTRVAQLLEERRDVDEIVGVDFVPPRRRLRRSEFRRIDPRDRDKLAAFAAEVAPDAVAHFGIYEPGSRLPSKMAARYTQAAAVAALGGAARAGRLARVVLRSGVAVYGRGRGRPGVPDEDAPVAPTTPFGRSLLAVEALAVDLGRRHDLPVTALRMATIAGSHMPSPLGRVLRLPAVPVPALADPVFQLLHADDAARSMVAGLFLEHDGPLERGRTRRRQRLAGGAARRARSGAHRRPDVVPRRAGRGAGRRARAAARHRAPDEGERGRRIPCRVGAARWASSGRPTTSAPSSTNGRR